MILNDGCIHSAVLRKFFRGVGGGGGEIKVSRNKGGKPSLMQNIFSSFPQEFPPPP